MQRKRLKHHWPWIAVAIVIVFVAVIRIRLLHIPLERDEGEFAYMGQLMLKGIPPYLLAYNMKFPGMYAAYALLMTFLGQTIAGIHLGLMVVNAAAIGLLFCLARKLFDDIAAAVAASSYALITLSPSVLGTSAHATQFIVPLVLGATLLLLRAIDSNRHAYLLPSGFLYGLAFLMKQHAVLFIAFALSYWIWSTVHRKPVDFKKLIFGSGLLLIAASIPFCIMCLWLYAAGVFKTFWFWTFSYGAQYVTEISPSDALKNLANRAAFVISYWAGVWALSGIGLTSIFWNKMARSQWRFLTAMTLFSFLSICPGFYFRNHYFVTMLPAVTMLAGVCISALTQLLSKLTRMPWATAFPALLIGASLVYPVIRNREFLFIANPMQACRMMYGTSPFPESVDIAKHIKAHTTESDTIAVFGSEPQIYFYADRKSATGYIYVYALMEQQNFAAKMQLEYMSEIEKARPKYVVLVNVATSWLKRRNSDTTVFDWAETYFGKNYRTAGIVDIYEDGHFTSRWNGKARSGKPSSSSNLILLERSPSSAF